MQPTHVHFAGGFFFAILSFSFPHCVARVFFHLEMKSLYIVWHYFVLASVYFLLCSFLLLFYLIFLYIFLFFGLKICNTENNLISRSFITFVVTSQLESSPNLSNASKTHLKLFIVYKISIQPRDSLDFFFFDFFFIVLFFYRI